MFERRGPKVEFAGGYMNTLVKLHRGTPVEIGVEMSESLMEINTLPTEKSDGKYDILNEVTGEVDRYCCGHEVFLEFHPSVVDKIPFPYVIINWNPYGHSPPGIYDAPHYDLHFYMIGNQERLSMEAPATTNETCSNNETYIPVTCEDYEVLIEDLPANQQVDGYMNVGAVEPAMGNHLIDLMAPEFNGGSFTHVWIYGSQGGDLSFLEPMVTLDYFLSLKDGTVEATNDGSVVTKSRRCRKGGMKVTAPIRLPEKVSVAGYYPSNYTMEYDPYCRREKEEPLYRLMLVDLVWLDAE